MPYCLSWCKYSQTTSSEHCTGMPTSIMLKLMIVAKCVLLCFDTHSVNFNSSKYVSFLITVPVLCSRFNFVKNFMGV